MQARRPHVPLALGLGALAWGADKSRSTESVSIACGNPFTGGLATQGITYEQTALLARTLIYAGGWKGAIVSEDIGYLGVASDVDSEELGNVTIGTREDWL